MSHVNVSVLSFRAVLKASAFLIALIPQVRDNLVVFMVFEMCSFLKICLVIPFKHMIICTLLTPFLMMS